MTEITCVITHRAKGEKAYGSKVQFVIFGELKEPLDTKSWATVGDSEECTLRITGYNRRELSTGEMNAVVSETRAFYASKGKEPRAIDYGIYGDVNLSHAAKRDVSRAADFLEEVLLFVEFQRLLYDRHGWRITLDQSASIRRSVIPPLYDSTKREESIEMEEKESHQGF